MNFITQWEHPLGLDTNHGFAKAPVINSEVNKKRKALRDRFFPSTYTHATWLRLLPFFRLPGHVLWDREVVSGELRPFNNRQLNRDLLAVCQRVNEVQPRLPDGRLLILHAPSSPFG